MPTIKEIIRQKRQVNPGQLFHNAADESRRLFDHLANRPRREGSTPPRLEIIPEGDALDALLAMLADDSTPLESATVAALGLLRQLPAAVASDGTRFYSIAAVESITPHVLAVIRANIATVEQAEYATLGRMLHQAAGNHTTARIADMLAHLQAEGDY